MFSLILNSHLCEIEWVCFHDWFSISLKFINWLIIFTLWWKNKKLSKRNKFLPSGLLIPRSRIFKHTSISTLALSWVPKIITARQTAKFCVICQLLQERVIRWWGKFSLLKNVAARSWKCSQIPSTLTTFSMTQQIQLVEHTITW